MPTSIGLLASLTDLKLDLNDFSGRISSSVSIWPVFTTNNTKTTVLYGNLWSCPIPDIVQEHSNEDPGHAYSCLAAAFVTPCTLTAISFALFVVAALFTKQCESVPSLIGTYTRGRHEVIPDASALVNVGHACFKLVGVILIAPVGLFFTYWHAKSNFEVRRWKRISKRGRNREDQKLTPIPMLSPQWQTTFIRLSSSMKSASDGLLLPVLSILTLLLLYFVGWGWVLRFEGHDNVRLNNNCCAPGEAR